VKQQAETEIFAQKAFQKKPVEMYESGSIHYVDDLSYDQGQPNEFEIKKFKN
jgi:hypothetical protein